MLQVLKTQFKQRIKDDELLQAKIGAAFKPQPKKISTVKRWLEEDHIMLTTSTVLDIVREHLELSKETELTEAKDETELSRSDSVAA